MTVRAIHESLIDRNDDIHASTFRLGQLAAEWESRGGTMEEYSQELNKDRDNPVSVRRLEEAKQHYLLSGEGIRSAVGERSPRGMCDFCNSTDVVWEYPCEDFSMQTPSGEPAGFGGAWAACAECAALIERDDRVALADRYVRSKPKAFQDILRPWTIRLHNQFVRHRTGSRRRPTDYTEQRGDVTVASADNAALMHQLGVDDVAERVMQTGEAALVIENADGSTRVIAHGEAGIERHLERRTIAHGYVGHPLLKRFFQHMNSMKAATGMWRSTEAWQALAEKYAMTLAAANTLGLSNNSEPGTMYFDPMLEQAGFEGDPEVAAAMGLYVTRALHDAVPYLWMSKVDELAAEPTLPPHSITRGLVHHKEMFWSFESAFGLPEARIDWMLILERDAGYEVWCPQANDVQQDGTVMLTGAVLGYGKRWPDDFRGPTRDLAEFLLKRLAFLNSKYVDVPHVRAHRNVRREVEREITREHHKMPENLGAYVVHLREREPVITVGQDPGDGKDFERKHCWYRRAHTRILHRDKPNERATWVRETLMGDPRLPLIRKVIVVDR
jgi:hypothetical protein